MRTYFRYSIEGNGLETHTGKTLWETRHGNYATATAEYAIGTLAAAGLATVLLLLVGGEWVTEMLRGLLQKALTVTK
ncbi:DUF4244 domain-containing protein [Saccharothrix sp. SC076]|nr:DUF4244 domain-containing protein [Saccharothrix obliqua]